MLVWLGPGSLAFGLAVLVAAAALGLFEHGTGVPTAGRSEGWAVLWGVLGVLVLGHVAGLVGSAAVLMRRRGSRRPRARALALSYDLVAGPLLLVGLCAA
jgi:hypothetical protein